MSANDFPTHRESKPFRLSQECPFYDCIGPHRAEPAVHVRRARVADPDYRAACGAADADGHFSGDSNPRYRGGLELYRAAAGRDGGTHRHAVSAGVDDHCQRHRAHRGELL